MHIIIISIPIKIVKNNDHLLMKTDKNNDTRLPTDCKVVSSYLY